MNTMSVVMGVLMSVLLSLKGLRGSVVQSVLLYTAAHKQYRVKQFPLFSGQMPSEHYSGELMVDEATGKRLFFYFATSERNTKEDPVVLWLNGGPGCTSLDGFLNEHGPFQLHFSDEGKLVAAMRAHAWTKVSNVIYLDSPSGVGLSYSDTPRDYTTNDTQTARDTLTFLKLFFEEFSEFAGNRFFIAGESYAGIYVPVLALAIHEDNLEAKSLPQINLQGYAIGNGCTDTERIDANAILPYAFRHSLLSTASFKVLEKACGGNFWNATTGSLCANLSQTAYSSLDGLNIYNIQLPCLHHKDILQTALRESRNLDNSWWHWPLPGGALKQGGRVHNWASLLGEVGLSPPCLDHKELWTWANDPEVRKAIHAAPVDTTGRFDECSGKIKYTHNAGSMIPIHLKLIAAGLEALIYSGDQDLCVPHTGSEEWTSHLGLPIKASWHPWHVMDNQVAGYKIAYEGLTYATVLGAGHAVPQLKGPEALGLISSFLDEGIQPQ